MRTYLTLAGQHYNDASYEWAGSNYNNILIKSGDSASDSVAVSDIHYTLPESNSTIFSEVFVFPQAIDFVSMIDGTASGSVVVTIKGGEGGSGTIFYAYLTGIEVEVFVIDSSGVERSMISSNIFSGTKQVGSSASTFGFLFWESVEDFKISVGERIALRVEATGYVDSNSDLYNSDSILELSRNSTDLSITLPMV